MASCCSCFQPVLCNSNPNRSEYIQSSVNIDKVVFLLEDFSSIACMSAIDSLQPFMNVLPQPKSCGYVARILRQA